MIFVIIGGDTMKRNIAIFRRDTGLHGGIERQIVRIVKGLIGKGFNVHFITDNEDTRMVQQIKDLKGIIHIVNLNNTLKGCISIFKICKKEKIEILQSHMLRESFLTRIVKIMIPSVKIVFRIHTYIDCSRITNFRKTIYHILSFITDFLVDCYIPINDYNVIEMVKRTHISRRKITIVHDGVESLGEYDDLSQRVWPEYRVDMIANFMPGKGHDILIKGIKLLKDEGIFVRARIIGGEKFFSNEEYLNSITHSMKELVRSLGLQDQITFLGYSDDIYNTIKGTNIIILPSESEGTPNSLLEAMSLKKNCYCI